MAQMRAASGAVPLSWLGEADMRIRSTGITGHTTQLAWTITLATLTIFVVFIIPEQKRDLQEGLESKAHGVAAALQGEVAGAAISEDYSSVVEHALQVVAGDPAVKFLVITKNGGYSVIVERKGWRIVPNMDATWHPAARVASSRIGLVPLFGARVFHYSLPFDYSGLEWGWIHVGLSLDTYDASVKSVYRRTGVLTVVCILLSLVASLLYARRFVRPVLRLRAVVERVANGDLAARADIHSNDEIEQLAKAFNSMADAVLQRDRIVESVRFTAQGLQGTTDWRKVMDRVVAKIGQAAGVSRVLLIESAVDPDTKVFPRIRFEWSATGIASCLPYWQNRSREELGLESRAKLLSGGQMLIEQRAHFQSAPFPGPDPQPQSAIVAPIFAGDRYWGALAVQDCSTERNWQEVEQDAVRAAADMLGASIARQHVQEALVEAKNELEQRVAERTRELREQIAAKDQARVELEEAQKRLIDLSRLSGMAEVATGVLHNVGNVLNSINVAANILTDRLRASRMQQLQELSRTLSEHQDSASDFLANDPRGQRILPYFAKLSSHLLVERDSMAKELEALVAHVSHVKEIVAMQQTYARTSGLLEKVPAKAVLQDALSITQAGMDRHGILLRQAIEVDAVLTTDRHKVLQIVLNLLRNAIDAVKTGSELPRRINIALRCPGPDQVRIEVADNGIGIAPENLARIFSHGFTTKKDGHGFGLHSGALAASQLGGSLRGESPGLGQGATFTLELPLQAQVKAEARRV
jgi:two-component system, NtrC family, sensor kinase